MRTDAFLSNWVLNTLWLNGKRFSFDMFPPKRVIYDDPSDFICQQTSRQVGKSTDLAALKIGYATSIRNFHTLFIAPQAKHKSDFSHQKLLPMIEGSPFIKRNFTSYRLTNNVDLKQFTNGSTMMLKFAYLSDLPLRGPSSDFNVWDEYQDSNPALFQIGQETLSHSIFKKTMVTGTPKTSITPLHKVWESSTKLEVLYKCTGCGHWNLPSMPQVQPHGCACEKCSKLLTPDIWEWVATGDPNSEIQGYHYNKLGLAIFGDPSTNWKKDVWNKLHGADGERKTPAQFKNEVLGEVDDDSVRPITVEDVKACCNTERSLMTIDIIEKRAYNRTENIELEFPLYCAIDWGTTNTTSSNTVLVLGAPDYANQEYIKIFLIKKFVGEESNYEFILNYIYKLYKLLPNIVFFSADNGMGAAPNSLIRNKIGYEKLFGFQFVPNQKEKAKWHVVQGSTQEQINAYFTVSKIIAYDQFFYEIKNNKWEFPKWEDFKEYGKEVLNVEQQFDEDRNKYIYTHLTENPDDVPSALIYLRLLIELSAGL
jgi:hypothetical protein